MSLTNLQLIFDDIRNTIDNHLSVNKLLGLKIKVRHSHIAASHNSPIGEPTIWRNSKSYAAMSGRIWMRFNNEAEGLWATNIFNKSPYHLGSGGGGDYESPWSAVYKIYYHRFGHAPVHNTLRGGKLFKPVLYGYTFNFWLDDFPEFRKAEQQRDMLRIIGGEPKTKDTLIEWTDTITAMIDDEFRWEPESGIVHRKIYNQSTRGI